MHLKKAVISSIMLLALTLACLPRQPVKELEAEIGLDFDLLEDYNFEAYQVGNKFFVDVDMVITTENYEDAIMTFGYLVGCVARALPDNCSGKFCMRTNHLDITMSLDECRFAYGMVLERASGEEILAYMDSVVVFSDR